MSLLLKPEVPRLEDRQRRKNLEKAFSFVSIINGVETRDLETGDSGIKDNDDEVIPL